MKKRMIVKVIKILFLVVLMTHVIGVIFWYVLYTAYRFLRKVMLLFVYVNNGLFWYMVVSMDRKLTFQGP